MKLNNQHFKHDGFFVEWTSRNAASTTRKFVAEEINSEASALLAVDIRFPAKAGLAEGQESGGAGCESVRSRRIGAGLIVQFLR